MLCKRVYNYRCTFIAAWCNFFLNKQARRNNKQKGTSPIPWGGPLLLRLIRRNNVDPGPTPWDENR